WRPASGAKSRITTHQRVHDRVLAPDHVFCCAVPIYLCVEMILVQTLRSVRQKIRCGSAQIGQWNQILDLAHDCALPFEWNHISWKRSAAGTIVGPSGGVINDRVVLREITHSLIGGRYRQKLRGAEPLVLGFPPKEVEEFVLNKWATQRHAVDIVVV